jgi:diphosphomevalonate decarboxylase
MKKTAIAPSNIAFIKYWGRKNEELRLPENGSISMCLSNLLTTTTVEFSKDFKKDFIQLKKDNQLVTPDDEFIEKAIMHLDRIRKIAKISEKAKIITHNNFPASTGLSSSASGFAALTVAGAAAAGLNLSAKELSILARQGSGSACRSIPDGFVEWVDGDTSETSYAASIYPSDYWDLVDVVAVVSTNKKDIATSLGQKTTGVNPFFPARKSHMKDKIIQIKKYMKEKNFIEFGKLIESEALELHAIFLISGLLYLLPESLAVMKEVRKWRANGLESYFTINTGQNVHIICEKKNEKKVIEKLKELSYVKEIISNGPSKGTHLTVNHLF